MQRARIPIAAILFAVCASAQTQTDQSVDRTFHFKNLSDSRQLAEIVAAFRQVAGIPQYSSDAAAATVTVRGTPEQVELASWLVDQLDVSTSQPGVHEYTTDGSIIRVFYLTNLTKSQSVQELITTLRQVTGLRKVSSHEGGALALRGTAEQVALAAWIIAQLDVPGVQLGVREYPGSTADGGASRIYYLTNMTSPRAINEIITALRQIASIDKLFLLQEKNAIALQATPADAKLAEWLIRGLDHPAVGRKAVTYVIADDRDDKIRIFYESKPFTSLPPIRSYRCDSAHALIVRGTSEQLTRVSDLIAGSN